MLSGHRLGTHTATANAQEANIFDVIGLFVESKLRILLTTSGAVLLGVAMSFLLPRQYQSSELLRLATIDGHPVESVDSLKAFFGSDIVLRNIAHELRVSPSEVRDRFSFKSHDAEKLIEIKGYGSTPEDAAALTQLMGRKVLVRLQDAYQPARDTFEKELVTLLEDQDGIQREFSRLERVRERLLVEIKFYQSEIAKRADAQSEAQGRIVESYIRILADTREQLDMTALAIEAAKQRSVVILETIQRKRALLAYSLMAPLVEAEAVIPEASAIPPRLVQNIIYSTVLGIFLSIVWVLVRGYHIERARRRD